MVCFRYITVYTLHKDNNNKIIIIIIIAVTIGEFALESVRHQKWILRYHRDRTVKAR
jgi:hypothetical protein